jgi:hypothetical protein
MNRLLPALALVLLVGAIVFLATTGEKPADTGFNPFPARGEGSAEADPGSSAVQAPQPGEIVRVAGSDPRLARYSDGSAAYLEALETGRRLHQGADPAHDLEIIRELLASYRYFFKANPVGSENAEITAQLLGQNKLRLRLLDPATTPLDSSGALVDRWGVPYFFHPLTAQVMGLRSAGPDQNLWTADDLESDNGEIEKALQLQSAN